MSQLNVVMLSTALLCLLSLLGSNVVIAIHQLLLIKCL